jgi:hypothetical protein
MKIAYYSALAGVLACTHPTTPTTTASPASASPPPLLDHVAPRVPMAAEWVVKSVSGNRTTLIARVTRNGPVRAAMQVTVRVPAGVTLVSGPTQFTIPASETAAAFDQEFVVESRGQPKDALVLEVDAHGDDFGIHSTQKYEFGRVAEEQKPQPQGPSVKIGSHDLGPAIPGK